MKEKGIIFTDDEVLATLSGRMTQIRRVIKPQPEKIPGGWKYKNTMWAGEDSALGYEVNPEMPDLCPFGQPGDRLWVRETMHSDGDGWWFPAKAASTEDMERFYFPEDDDGIDGYQEAVIIWIDKQRKKKRKKVPSSQMPRWASRITLEITDIRVERLQDITDSDAIKEGVDRTNTSIPGYAVERFKRRWNRRNEKKGHGWDKNPWIWKIDFKPVG